MKTSAFFEALPALFTPDVHSGDPVDGAWKDLTAQVAGYTAVNELAVLNEAARHLPEGEAYLEVGTFKGRSICAAVRGNAGKKFVVMENFMEFGMAGEMARKELMTNLAQHASDADVELLEGDCFKLMVEPGALDRPVGVYFYDGEHTLLSHYLALAVVEPLLADEALVLIDDASWPVVQKAHKLFLQRHKGWEIVETWDAAHADDPRWANGLHALTFRRVPGTTRKLSGTDEALRRYQVTVQDRVNAVMWKAVGIVPGPITAVAKVLLGRSRKIGDDDSAK
ncbi:hypothetical protein AA983_13080 [Dermacoccus sp. PE3]|uniref:class I SAM-dependent methyltransferase n=1 Tax=Dermacoccus sp. PE3 TaxID=1641401 RepID=UPI000641AA75|nr:class I SAM-dependent methyltransferase [Dermacoccus sp. PE3]KLO61886.1 hypothetical protein AA983_13080 [Dermacoccus sp. PE3]